MPFRIGSQVGVTSSEDTALEAIWPTSFPTHESWPGPVAGLRRGVDDAANGLVLEQGQSPRPREVAPRPQGVHGPLGAVSDANVSCVPKVPANVDKACFHFTI